MGVETLVVGGLVGGMLASRGGRGGGGGSPRADA